MQFRHINSDRGRRALFPIRYTLLRAKAEIKRWFFGAEGKRASVAVETKYRLYEKMRGERRGFSCYVRFFLLIRNESRRPDKFIFSREQCTSVCKWIRPPTYVPVSTTETIVARYPLSTLEALSRSVQRPFTNVGRGGETSGASRKARDRWLRGQVI